MTTSLKIVHWTPRVLCILAVLFVSIFALDAFDPKLTIWQQIGGFLIHLLPSFILAGLLILAWKYELVGGIIITALALGTAPSLFVGNYRMNHSVWMSLGVVAMINLPFIITGSLFILSYFLKKKNSNLS
jgi:hypothetical protein